MKKVILAVLISLIFAIGCGEDSDTKNDSLGKEEAKIAVNGVEFTKSVSCSAVTNGEILVVSISAIDSSGNTLAVGGDLSKNGENYEFLADSAFSISYTEAATSSYIATDEDGGTFSASFKGTTIKASFDVVGKLSGLGTTKNLKGSIECTVGGAVN